MDFEQLELKVFGYTSENQIKGFQSYFVQDDIGPVHFLPILGDIYTLERERLLRKWRSVHMFLDTDSCTSFLSRPCLEDSLN